MSGWTPRDTAQHCSEGVYNTGRGYGLKVGDHRPKQLKDTKHRAQMMRDLQSMSNSQSTSFECPNCAAKYEVVRVDAPPGPTIDREITCVSCGGPLQGREGPFVLKYFLIERRKRRAGSR
jgi:hypothetical protein